MPSTLPEGRARGRPVTYVVTEEANESATTRAAAELEPFQLLAVRSHNVKVSGLCCGCGQPSWTAQDLKPIARNLSRSGAQSRTGSRILRSPSCRRLRRRRLRRSWTPFTIWE